jgi:uncharacterized alkaline shock family protein YloU
MAIVNFSNLDFDQIKTTIKDYLKSNSSFTDYDFEGSSLSVLIDILAYNTYITSYNANMISNEVFLDSATLRENIIGLARNIGYTPRSVRSARVAVSFSVDLSSIPENETKPLSLTIQPGTAIKSNSALNGGITFSVMEPITVPVVGSTAIFDQIEVIEGNYIVETFKVDQKNPSQKFILNNPNIDTTTIRVVVYDKVQEIDGINRTFARKYSLSETIFDIKPNSRVFYLQEISDQRYELIFGDGIFGAKLENESTIEVSYVISSGPDANGASTFAFSGRILDNNQNLINNGISLVTSQFAARGGREIESVNSIRSYAPRIYSSQYRAVTASDYESIIAQIYPETESISVFGGETLNPPKYGKVFVTIKPYNGQFIPNYIKENIKSAIKKYSVAGIVVEVLDLKYLWVEIDVNLYYNSNEIDSINNLKTIVYDRIQKYADSSELNSYGSRFKYSKFQNLIDQTSTAITSNITRVSLRRDIRTVLNKFAGYEICYGNEFFVQKESGYNIKSSGFNVEGITETVYLGDLPEPDKKTGKLFLFKFSDEKFPVTVRKSVGTVDYVKGEILLYPINIIQTSKVIDNENLIEISAIPKSNDIIGLQDLYLQLDKTKIQINTVSDTLSSGDNAGTNYIFSSSYSNGDIVRR